MGDESSLVLDCDPMELSPAILAPGLFLFLFPAFWCAVCWLLSHVGGWNRLGTRFATHQTPHGASFRWQNGSVGFVSYRNVMRVDAAPDGIFLSMPWLFRVGHPPLFIPWSEVHDATEQRLLWLRLVRFGVGSPRLARLRLPAKVFEAVEAGRVTIKSR